MPTVYQDLVTAGCEIDSHYSDLYVIDSPSAREIIARHRKAESLYVTPGAFTTCPALGSQRWLEIPFAYDPYWEAKQARTV